jgi:hypothetical protein
VWELNRIGLPGRPFEISNLLARASSENVKRFAKTGEYAVDFSSSIQNAFYKYSIRVLIWMNEAAKDYIRLEASNSSSV